MVCRVIKHYAGLSMKKIALRGFAWCSLRAEVDGGMQHTHPGPPCEQGGRRRASNGILVA